MSPTDQPRLLFVVESGTDVRMIEGLADHFRVDVLARRILGGREINHPPSAPFTYAVGPAGRIAFARRVRKAVAAAPHDTVLVQGYGPAALAANLASRRRRVPTAMLVCSPLERYYRCRRTNPVEGKPFRRRELLGLRLLARLNGALGRHYIALSQHLATEIRRAVPRARVSVIPVYGVDTAVFVPAEARPRAYRAQLGFPADAMVVFFSSRIAPEKDAITVLEAVRALRADGRNVWLLHRSGGHRQFHDAARARGLDGAIVASDAVDPRTDLARDYQASDVCVQASREEGLGLAPLEALACETPVVAAAVGGLRETIRDGATGWTYPPGDAAALAAQLAHALDHPDEARRRAREGRAMVQATYERRRAFADLAAVIAP